LRSVTRDRTTLLIAHRRSTLALAERIAVLDRGIVVDVGTHEELTERCGLYHALLAGPDEAIEDASHAAELDLLPGPAGTTPALWPDREPDLSVRNGHKPPEPVIRAPRGGMAGGGMGPGDAMLGAIPPTPELLEQVRALPPATEQPDLQGEDP